MRSSVCVVCRRPVPLSAKGEPRKVCAKPSDCATVLRKRIGARGNAVKARRWRQSSAARWKVCPCCGVRKARTSENFAVAKRAPDGSVTTLDSTCKPCRAAEARDRYASDPERRRKVLARAKRQRERIEARCAVDPEFAAEWAEKRRRWDRERAARLRDVLPEPEPLRVVHGGPRLPGQPLGEAIERAARFVEGGFEPLCELVGVAPRTVYAWKTGERSAELVNADGVLEALDLLWWEVWDPERYPEVVAVFEGEEAAAA